MNAGSDEAREQDLVVDEEKNVDVAYVLVEPTDCTVKTRTHSTAYVWGCETIFLKGS